MPDYIYKGKDLQNKVVKGVINANSQSDCYAELKSKNIFAYSVKEKDAKGEFEKYKLKPLELADFSRQMGTMQTSGIPVVRALEILSHRATKPGLVRVYHKLASVVLEGNSLSDAMKTCQGSFPDTMINMYIAGESNGKLDETAIKTAKYFTSEHKIKTKIKNAMAYPIILGIITLVITVVLFTFVLPLMFDLIENGGGTISGLTAAILGISKFLINQWYIAVAGVIVLVIAIFAICTYQKEAVDKMKLGIPKFGALLSIIYTSKFSRTLSSLYSSGVSMVEAVEMSSKTMGNLFIQNQFIEVARRIQNGQPLSIAIEGTAGIERKLISAIEVGEETGRLETMLNNISDDYEFESESAIERMLSYIEPLMIVVMGLVIGIVLLSVWGPMMEMYNSAY